MIPDLKLGVVVLTNQEADAGLFSIANTVLDHYLSAPPKDWVSSFSAVVKRHHEDAESAVKGQEASATPQRSHRCHRAPIPDGIAIRGMATL